MKRRDLLAGGALAGVSALSGCVSANPLVASAAFTYTPPNPVVGEKIVFDATESNASEWQWFFDTAPKMLNFDAEGARVTHAFEESGAHTVTLRVTAPFGLVPGLNMDRTTKTVYVEKQPPGSASSQKPISISTDRVSLHLRGVRTRVALDEAAVLQFSAANLDSDSDLSVRLVLKPPSGVDVLGTSLVESGNGQYARTLTLPPGESSGLSIRIKGNRTGRFEVVGVADYAFDDENEQTRRGMIPIVVTDG